MSSKHNRLKDLTPEQLAKLQARLAGAGGAQPAAQPDRIPRADRTGELALSFAQQRLWFLDRLQPGSAAYNMPMAYRLRGDMDPARMERVLGALVRRHESLRTVFPDRGGEPAQVILDAMPVPVPVTDLRGVPPELREAELRRLAAEEAARPFDLAAGPLVRAAALRLDEREWAVTFTLHHVVSDGLSTMLLMRDVAELYGAMEAGRPPALPPLSVQYADYAVWQRGWLESGVMEEQMGWWREQLAGAPPLLELPTDRPRPAVATVRGGAVPFSLSEPATAALRAFARAEGATMFMALMAAWQTLLGRYAGTEDVSVGTPVAARPRRELENLIGFFANTLVIRTDLSGAPGFRTLLRRVRETSLGAFARQDVPLDRMVGELAPERSLRHTPLFQVLFSLLNATGGDLRLGSLEAELVDGVAESVKFDLTLTVGETDDGLRGTISYRAELFERATAERMVEHLRALLEGIAADPDRPVAEIPLVSEDERRLLLETWNATDADHPQDACVHRLFEAHAAAHPDAPAVACEGDRLTAGELNARANRLAHHLRGLGVGPDTVVAMFLERGVDSIVALLGILKAGGAYLALDPALPAERLRYMLEDSGAAALVTRGGLAASLPAGDLPVVRMDGDALNGESTADVESGVRAEHLAYTIYTSGSTGRPKGVAVEHRQLAGYLYGVRDRLGLEAGASYATVSTLSADLGHTTVFSALAWGGCLHVIAEERIYGGAALADYFDHNPVDVLKITPSHLAALQGGVDDPRRLMPRRRLVLGGEASGLAWADELVRMAPEGCAVFNHYGPTETTVGALTFRMSAERPETPSSTVVIGAPLPNVRAYVVDGGLRPVPIGVAGELLIGGAGVARGYLHRPSLTAERFIPDPFGAGRVYRTGDRVRRLPNGSIEFQGRMDGQVKIRGFRVETGEVEAALRDAGAADCAVVAREDAPGERRLVAYVVGEADADTLRAHLRRGLPEHMVPSAFVALERLPLTPNGKLDRRALPAPEGGPVEARYTPPQSEIETALAEVWAEVLGLDRVGRDDGFFDLGGHSLMATRLVSRVRERLGVELPLRTVFEAPTVRGLAARVEALWGEGGTPQAPPVVPVPRGGALPLSFAQQRLWFLDQLEPGSAAYHIPRVLRLRGGLDAGALERALTEIVRRHEALRTRFPVQDGEPSQVIEPAGPVSIPVQDLRELPADVREAEARRIAGEEARAPFDLAHGPLLRARLLRLADEEHALLFTLHHIVSDGWSTGLLVREVSELYGAFTEGRTPSLPELPVQYADYAAWQRAWLRDEVLEAQLDYWRTALAGAPPLLELPTDRPRPPVPGDRGASVSFALPEETLRAVQALSRREGATPFMTLLAAWQLLLARYSGQDDVSVGAPVAGRTRMETEGLIGFFVNTLVLRADLSGAPSFRELVGRVREATLGAHQHQDVPFEKLVEELAPERSMGHAPLFQVLFGLQNNAQETLRLGDLAAEPMASDAESAKFDLTLSLTETEDGLAGSLDYRAELWDAATMERMAAHFAALVQAACADPDAPAWRLEMVDDAERAVLLGSDPAVFPADAALHELFAAQAARTPEAPALTFGETTLAYGELDARANQLAHALRKRGVGPEVRVGLYVERSIETVVGLLGILKAGGAYVPMDVAYPADRIGFMLADSGVPVLLTQSALVDRLPEHDAEVIRLDADWAEIGRESTDAPESGAAGGTLAYVIYTSGIHRDAQGRAGGASQRRAPVPRDGGVVRLRRGRRVDALPLARVRLLRLGDLGRAAVRRAPGRRALRRLARSGRLPSHAGGRGRDGAEPDAVRLSAAGARGRGFGGCGPAGAADRGLRRRGAGAGEPAPLVRAARGCVAAAGEHVRHHGDDGARHLSSPVRGGRGGGGAQPHRRADPGPAAGAAGPLRAARPPRRSGGDLRGRRGRRARLPESPGADGGAVHPRSVLGGCGCDAVSLRRSGTHPRGRGAGVPGTHRPAGEGARLPHRAGRDRGGAAGPSRRGRGRRRSARGRARRRAAGGVRGAGPRARRPPVAGAAAPGAVRGGCPAPAAGRLGGVSPQRVGDGLPVPGDLPGSQLPAPRRDPPGRRLRLRCGCQHRALHALCGAARTGRTRVRLRAHPTRVQRAARQRGAARGGRAAL